MGRPGFQRRDAKLRRVAAARAPPRRPPCCRRAADRRSYPETPPRRTGKAPRNRRQLRPSPPSADKPLPAAPPAPVPAAAKPPKPPADPAAPTAEVPAPDKPAPIGGDSGGSGNGAVPSRKTRCGSSAISSNPPRRPSCRCNFPFPAESVFLDLCDRAKLRLTGADRVRFLNGQVSNDVRRATRGQSVYTGVMTIKGKLCADAFIHAGDDFLLLDAEARIARNARRAAGALHHRRRRADRGCHGRVRAVPLLDFAPATAHARLPARWPTSRRGRAVRSERFGRAGLDLFFEAARDTEVRERLHAAGFTLLNDDAAGILAHPARRAALGRGTRRKHDARRSRARRPAR